MISNVMSQVTSGANFPGVGGINGIQELITSNGSSPAWNSPFQYSSVFDDFATGLENVNFPFGALGWAMSVTGNGAFDGVNEGNATPGVTGRVGLLSFNTWTTLNNTGQATISLGSGQTWPGQVQTFTMQWAAMIPTLSTSLVAFNWIGGLGQPFTYPPTNGCWIQYSGTTTTASFAAAAANASTQTTVTGGSSFVVVPGNWYNFMINIPAAGASGVNYYVGSPGGTYAFLGNISTNLPTSGAQCCPNFTIVKGSTSTTARTAQLDWCKIDFELSALR